MAFSKDAHWLPHFSTFISVLLWPVGGGGCAEAGEDALFQLGRKLVGDRTAKLRLNMVRVTESQFADDVALYTRSRDCLESATKKFVEGTKEWAGLNVYIEKKKQWLWERD